MNDNILYHALATRSPQPTARPPLFPHKQPSGPQHKARGKNQGNESCIQRGVHCREALKLFG